VRYDLTVIPNPVPVPTLEIGFMSDGAPQYSFSVVDWHILQIQGCLFFG
jgi:hypothetical protein